MIRPAIDDAIVRQSRMSGNQWTVTHPSNGAILAYADTEAEAVAYKEALNDLARQLRAIGFECK